MIIAVFWLNNVYMLDATKSVTDIGGFPALGTGDDAIYFDWHYGEV